MSNQNGIMRRLSAAMDAPGRRARRLAWAVLPLAILTTTTARGEFVFPAQVKEFAEPRSTNFTFNDANAAANPFVFDKYSGPLPLGRVDMTIDLHLICNVQISALPVSGATATVNYLGGVLQIDTPTGMVFDLGGPGQPSLLANLPVQNFVQTSTTTPVTQTLTGEAHFTHSFTSEAEMAQFLGAAGDTFLFPSLSNAATRFTISPANGAASVTTQAQIRVSVQYAAVPEPTSLALLALGGLATWHGLRRRGPAGSRISPG